MGTGIDAARIDAPEHAAMLDNFKDQLLLALVKQAGGSLSIPIKDVDATGGYVMLMSVDAAQFHFTVQAKQ